MNLGQNIENIRKEKGVKQTVIAEKLGITQSTYSEKVRHFTDFKYSVLSGIAEILEVSVIDIITYPERWAPETETCAGCREKNRTIANLNKYIEKLEADIETMKSKQ